MTKMMLKETVMGIIERMDFSESVEIKMDCPKCKRKETVIRRISKERQQSIKGRWYIETCQYQDCDYWDAGFTL